MLRKQKKTLKANRLFFPKHEMDAIVDGLVETQLVSGDGLLELPKFQAEQPVDQWVRQAPSFFLCLAKALEDLSNRGTAPGAHFPTLCLSGTPHPIDFDPTPRFDIRWFPAMLEVLAAVELLPEPHDRQPENSVPANTNVSADRERAEQEQTDQDDSLGIGNPIPEKVIQLLVTAFEKGRFDSPSLQSISKLITGWASPSDSLTLFTFDSKRSQRTLAILKSIVQHLRGQAIMLQNRLEDKLAAMKELAYGASHEFNNPLANIATRAQTLARDEPSFDRKQQLQIINAQAFRGFDMLANLMHFASPPLPKFENCDFKEAVSRAIREVEQFFGPELKTRLLYEPPAELPSIWADSQQLQLLLKAILRNAVEAGGSQVNVCLHGSHLPNGQPGVVAQIEDRGQPVDANLLPSFCDPFFSGREAGRGLGFGLAIAYQIVKQHGGQLQMTAIEPQGLQVKIVLPCRETARTGNV